MSSPASRRESARLASVRSITVAPRSRSRDLPARRVTSASPPAINRLTLSKQKRRTLASMVDQHEVMPGKIRKSNSENRRPPALQIEKKSLSLNKRSVLGEKNISLDMSGEGRLSRHGALKKEKVIINVTDVHIKDVRVDIIPVSLPAELNSMRINLKEASTTTSDIFLASPSSTSVSPVLPSAASAQVSPPPEVMSQPPPGFSLPPTPTTAAPCSCSAELPDIKQNLSSINHKLAVLTSLVLKLKPAEAAQEDSTAHKAVLAVSSVKEVAQEVSSVEEAVQEVSSVKEDDQEVSTEQQCVPNVLTQQEASQEDQCVVVHDEHYQPSGGEGAKNRCGELEKLSGDNDGVIMEAVTSNGEDDLVGDEKKMRERAVRAVDKTAHQESDGDDDISDINKVSDSLQDTEDSYLKASRKAALEDSDEDAEGNESHNPWDDSSAEEDADEDKRQQVDNTDDDEINNKAGPSKQDGESEADESGARVVDRLCNLGNLARGREERMEAEGVVMTGDKSKNGVKTKQLLTLSAFSSESEADDDNLDEDSHEEDDGCGVGKMELGLPKERVVLESYEDESMNGEDEESFEDEDSSTDDADSNHDDTRKPLASGERLKGGAFASMEVEDAASPTRPKKRRSKRLGKLLNFPLTDSDDEEDVREKDKNAKRKVRSKKKSDPMVKIGEIVNEAESERSEVVDDEECSKTALGGEDCSCPSCRRDLKELVKFSGKDLKSSVCGRGARQEHEDISPSPSPSPPQLDAYFDEVEVSFEELASLPDNEEENDAEVESHEEDDMMQDLPSSAVLQQSEQPQQNKKVEKVDKVTVEDLWGFKEKTVAKVKPGPKTDVENGMTETVEDTPGGKERDEDDIVGDDEEEEYGVKETYSEYSPVYLSYGKPHPDPVVESSSLASVLPPAITRSLHLPQDLIDKGSLSKVQLEAVAYASQMHEVMMPNNSRAGFLIGDGAGVGKGRTIAGIILENWNCGRRRSVWVSASQDLLLDATRDLEDIGAKDIKVASLTKFGYDKKVKWEGVIYSTFAGLVGTTKDKNKLYKSRLEQLLDWLGQDGQFQGPMVFDECHKAKNLMPVKGGKPTKTGLAVLDLQNKNPRARVVYASATGASEPKNMAYMVRLGMWGQGINFSTFKDFSQALERRGTGGLEQVALDLKLRGNYIARQLSFKGVDFGIEEVPLTQEFIEVYDQSVEVWRKLQVLLYDLCPKYPLPVRGDPRKRNFWGFMQKYFKYLAISSKISHVVGLAKKELAAGNCVVIGLQSTGEAATEKEMITKAKEKLFEGDDDDDFVDESEFESGEDEEIKAVKVSQFSSASSKMIRSVVTKLIPCQHVQVSGTCDPAQCVERKVVWEAVMELVPRLPTSSLDQLIEELGGPSKVAELTGRKKRLERGCDGVYTYVKRMPEAGSYGKINISEKKLFMSGKKKVAIISEAASTGISLQADLRVKNQRRRVHITIELPWSADSAIQQFGRTHRSNQSSAPKYVFIISALHGEKRFASIVAKRLESLGALTHGDRRSTRTSDLSTFNFHTDYAASALKNMVLAITEGENMKMPSPPPQWKSKGVFFTWLADRMEEAGIYSVMGVLDEEKYPSITKFMNRLLCVKVQDQNVIFSYFAATLDRVIAQAKREGRYDTGIVDVVGQEKASQVDQHSFKVKHATGVTTTKVTKFLITRGMSFEEATELNNSLQHSTEGFWTSRRAGLKFALLAIAIPDAGHYRMWKFLVYRPNTGKVFTTMPYDDLRDKYQKVKPEVAQKLWNKQYMLSMDLCTHAYKSNDHSCKIIRLGGECEDGRRRKTYHVSSGSLLSIWPQIENALGSCEVKSARKIQMVRINNEEGRIIGINIPNQVAGRLIRSLKEIDLTQWNKNTEQEQNNLERGGKVVKTGQKVAAVQYQVAGKDQSGQPSLVRQLSQQAASKTAAAQQKPNTKQPPPIVVPTVTLLASKTAQQHHKPSNPRSILIQKPDMNLQKLNNQLPSSQPPQSSAQPPRPVASSSSPSLLPCSPPTSPIPMTKPRTSFFSKAKPTFFKQGQASSATAASTKFKFPTQESKKPAPQQSGNSLVTKLDNANPTLSPVVLKLTNKPSRPDVLAEYTVKEKETGGK